ncbi:MAG TPA: hypothetical protein VLE99_00900 [Candidatus Saccharimonadales bacterium]|nr:hypothetical protein [Candidatus Saccharimonadales bacterium]
MPQDQFVYTEFRVSNDRRTVDFEYRTEHGNERYTFVESYTFPVALKDTPEQQRALRALHLAAGVSYYKKFLPTRIVHPYAMDETEAAFWNDVWQNGLGEFLYVNKLPVERVAKFAAQAGTRYNGESGGTAEGALLGIGGGKDSIVAGELLKKLDVPVTGFVLATGEQVGQAAAVAKTMGVELQVVERRLDEQLISLKNHPDSYSGHVPISMLFGLTGTALAIALDKAHVVVANEASASIPRVTWQERAINHQWSKSFRFEQSLQRFIQTSVAAQVTYFSAIRPLTSIGVAKLFAKMPDYYEVFTSDNFVFRIDPSGRPVGRWGLESPKSLSSYLLLAPWLTDEEVRRIFEIDFLNEPSLEKLFLELTGVEGEPPLDCVGTVEELVLSVNLLAETGRYHDTHLMRVAMERGVIHQNDWQAKLAALLALQPDEALPAELREGLMAELREGVSV